MCEVLWCLCAWGVSEWIDPRVWNIEQPQNLGRFIISGSIQAYHWSNPFSSSQGDAHKENWNRIARDQNTLKLWLGSGNESIIDSLCPWPPSLWLWSNSMSPLLNKHWFSDSSPFKGFVYVLASGVFLLAVLYFVKISCPLSPWREIPNFKLPRHRNLCMRKVLSKKDLKRKKK